MKTIKEFKELWNKNLPQEAEELYKKYDIENKILKAISERETCIRLGIEKKEIPAFGYLLKEMSLDAKFELYTSEKEYFTILGWSD